MGEIYNLNVKINYSILTLHERSRKQISRMVLAS